MSKSHVGMGFSLCPVCGIKHDEVVLLDRRLKETLEHENFMGWAMCPEHEKLRADGYIALIEVKGEPEGKTANLSTVGRTGMIAHVKGEVFTHIFQSPPPEQGIGFVPEGFIAKLQEAMKPQEAA
jgi:hypothetical protein